MTRSEYLYDLRNRLSKLDSYEREEAINFYEELFDERGIGYDDQVPLDFTSPQKASYEIFRDISAERLEDQQEESRERGKTGKRPGKLTTIFLLILSSPITIPLAITLLLLLLVVAIVIFFIFVAGIQIVGAAILVMFIYLPPESIDLFSILFCIGMALLGFSISIWAIKMGKSLNNFVKNKLIEYRKR